MTGSTTVPPGSGMNEKVGVGAAQRCSQGGENGDGWGGAMLGWV